MIPFRFFFAQILRSGWKLGGRGGEGEGGGMMEVGMEMGVEEDGESGGGWGNGGGGVEEGGGWR